MTRPGAPALTDEMAARWRAALVPWWVPRILLVAGWVVAVVAAAAGDAAACTAADPGVCGADVSFAWAAVPLFATPVLLWWLPLGGCAAGTLFAVLDVMYDDVPSARVAFGVHGLLCVAVGGWLVASRRRQLAIVAETAVPVRLDPVLAERVRSAWSGWGERTVAAGALVVAGIAGVGWYGHRADTVAAHVSAAVRVDATVRAVDAEHAVITVEGPQGLGPTRLDVLEPADYDAGQVVPVLVDRTGDEPWVRLVAEPEDPTGWLTAGLGAFALAGVLLVREQRMRSARRRVLRGPVSAVEVTTEPDDNGHAALQAGAGARRVLLGVVPVTAVPVHATASLMDDDNHDDDDDGHWTPDEVDAFGRGWRGETDGATADVPALRGGPRETATAIGDLRDGGRLMLVTDTAVLLPEAPLRVPRRLPWQAPAQPPVPEPLPGQPLAGSGPFPADDSPGHHAESPLPDLPVLLRPRRRDRAVGVLSVSGFVAGPAAVLAGVPDGWWQTVVVLWLGGTVGVEGLGRLSRRVRLTHSAIVVHGMLHVHHVPWARLHGVRRDGDRLFLAWDPDVIIPVGPFATSPPAASTVPGAVTSHGTAAVAAHWGAVMMRQRDRGRAAGDPGERVTTWRGIALAGGAAYALAALALIWWQHH